MTRGLMPARYLWQLSFLCWEVYFPFTGLLSHGPKAWYREIPMPCLPSQEL